MIVGLHHEIITYSDISEISHLFKFVSNQLGWQLVGKEGTGLFDCGCFYVLDCII